MSTNTTEQEAAALADKVLTWYLSDIYNNGGYTLDLGEILTATLRKDLIDAIATALRARAAEVERLQSQLAREKARAEDLEKGAQLMQDYYECKMADSERFSRIEQQLAQAREIAHRYDAFLAQMEELLPGAGDRTELLGEVARIASEHTSLQTQLAREKARAQLMQDHYECKMADSERFSRIEQQLAQAREAQQWRPIESAPKDGTRILAIEWPNLDAAKGFHLPVTTEWHGNGWTGLGGGYFLRLTHWMPLPTVMQQAAQQRGREGES